MDEDLDFVERSRRERLDRENERERQVQAATASKRALPAVAQRLERLVEGFRASGNEPVKIETGRILQPSPGRGWILGYRAGKQVGDGYELWLSEAGIFYLRKKVGRAQFHAVPRGVKQLTLSEATTEFMTVTEIDLLPGDPLRCRTRNYVDGGYNVRPVTIDDFFAEICRTRRSAS